MDDNIIKNYLDKSAWDIKENANQIFCSGHLTGYIAGKMAKEYLLNNIISEKGKQYFNDGRIHIHDLSARLCAYCVGFSTSQVIINGLKGPTGRISSAPPKHFDSAINQLTNFIGIMSQEFNGAISLNEFSLYLAPLVYYDKLDYKKVKQGIQSFCYHMNQPNRWGECVPITTEVLTPSGWKKYNELKIGDDIYTWDKTGNLNIQKIKQLTIQDYKGELHSYESYDYKQIVSPNHRILRKSFNYDKDFKLVQSNDLINFKSPLILPITVLDNKLGGIEYSDELIELLGFILVNGFFDDMTNCIDIRMKSTIRIEKVLKSLNIEHTKNRHKIIKYILNSTYSIQIYNILFNSTLSKIPDIFLSMNKHQSKLFIKSWSTICKQYNPNIIKLKCETKEIADSIQHICMLAGYGTFVKTKGDCFYVFTVSEPFRCVTKKSKILDYDGKIWCPSTDDGIVIFRNHENQTFISGNCPFSNITIGLTIPDDLKNNKAIVGGELKDKTYSEFEPEMNMINNALLDVLIEGDSVGTPLTFPVLTIGIDNNFPWDSEIAKKVFQVTAKYGTPFFENFSPETGRDPSNSRSMCCRLSLKTQDIIKHTGGHFGNGDSMGSLSVVTINLNRIGYLAKTTEEYYNILDELLDVSKDILVQRREFIIDMFNRGLYPYSKLYLSNYNTFFNTIGIIGGNESMINFMGKTMMDDTAITFMEVVLNHINDKCKEFQDETGQLFNSESVPGEGCIAEATPIKTINGNIPIKDLVGQENVIVWSYDETTRQHCLKKAYNIRKTRINAELIRLYFDDGTYLDCTPDHLIAKNCHEDMIEWIQAKDLKIGTDLNHKLTNIGYLTEKEDVYNMEVEDTECYYLGNGILIHNCSHSLALEDKKLYGNDIITAGIDHPYLTNSTLPPVEETDILDVINTQERLQSLYTGGTALNLYLGEKLDNYLQAKKIVKAITENTKIPYFSLNPIYSICKTHGYLVGEHIVCPTCGEPTEIFSRVVGYLKPRSQFNDGKTEEFKNRKYFKFEDFEGIIHDKVQ